jgi:Ser/Thr protein kinase RdoA (MazF antagonist)
MDESPAHPLPPVVHSVFDTHGLAQLVASDYTLPLPVECQLLRSGVNDIYLITSQDQRFVLRLARAQRYGHFDDAAYRFELDLLRFLHDSSVPVAVPLLRHNGDMLGYIPAPEGQRAYALFRYLDGKLPATLHAEQTALLGAALARFHRVTMPFSSSHPRPTLDAAQLIDEPMQAIRKSAYLPSIDVAFLERLAMVLRSSLQDMPRSGDAFGIVHGDFWWQNTLVVQGRVVLFDFEFCGWGWRVYDLATLLMSARALDYPLSEAAVESFLSAYHAIRPLDTAERQSLPLFLCLRMLWGLGFWSSLAPIIGSAWYEQTFSAMVAKLRLWAAEAGLEDETDDSTHAES